MEELPDDEVELAEDSLGNVSMSVLDSNPDAVSSTELGASILDGFFYED